MWKHILIKPLMLVAIFALVLLPAGEAFARCIKWSDARAVIAKNKLMKPGDVRRRAIRGGGEKSSVLICAKRAVSYVYRLTVIGRKKRVRDVVIDARSGSTISGRRSGKSRKRKSGRKLEDRIINRVKRNLRRHGINYY